MMDYGIGMFLAGLISGAGIGWYSGILRMPIRQTDPKKTNGELKFYRYLLGKAGLTVDGDAVDSRARLETRPRSGGVFVDLCRLHTLQDITDNNLTTTKFFGGAATVVALAAVSAAFFRLKQS